MKQKFFWNFFALSIIQQMFAIWFLILLPFLNPACTCGSSWFSYCWSLSWRILGITLLTCEMSAIVQLFKHCSALPCFGIGMKFNSSPTGHCWIFQICWHIECSILTASSFRIWNSSVGIPSPYLPSSFVIVMLPKAHLTSHCISGFRGVTRPS